MTETPAAPVLVTGATGRVGRAVTGLLVEAGVPVRALTRRSAAEVVTGDLTVPESLDTALRGAGTVFLVLAAWGAAMGRPAFVSSAVADILGSARSFRDWGADHVPAFLEGPASH
jgi:uncharacterized protein YbjT (DUF2867 family)